MRRRWWSSVALAGRQWSSHDCATQSAALAFYASLSLFPICVLLVAGLGWLSHSSSEFQVQQEQFLAAVERNASPWLAGQLQAMLAGIKTKAGVAGPVGFVTLLLAAISAFVQLDNGFAQIWAVPPSSSKGIAAALKTALYDRWAAFLLLLGIGSLTFVVFLMNILLAGVRSWLLRWHEGHALWQVLQIAITIGLNALLFTMLYKTLPKAAVGWGAAFAGGFLAALIWQAGQRILESFVISDKYSAYGILGSFMAVMLWMYYASAVLFFGAEFARVLGFKRPVETSVGQIVADEEESGPQRRNDPVDDMRRK